MVLKTVRSTLARGDNDMKKVLTVLLLMALPLLVTAETDSIKTGLSGTIWRDFSEIQKVIYLKGIYSGIIWGQSKDKESFITNTSLDTVVDGVDAFYEDFQNRNIIVFYAVKIVSRQLRGDKQEDIQSDVLEYRKTFSIVIDKVRQQPPERDK
jgi:hypothetical protein